MSAIEKPGSGSAATSVVVIPYGYFTRLLDRHKGWRDSFQRTHIPRPHEGHWKTLGQTREGLEAKETARYEERVTQLEARRDQLKVAQAKLDNDARVCRDREVEQREVLGGLEQQMARERSRADGLTGDPRLQALMAIEKLKRKLAEEQARLKAIHNEQATITSHISACVQEQLAAAKAMEAADAQHEAQIRAIRAYVTARRSVYLHSLVRKHPDGTKIARDFDNHRDGE